MPVDPSAPRRTSPAASTGEIKSLTGLRGIAASLVMLYHFTADDAASGLFPTFIRKGYIWVDLFFVLSGFIMALGFTATFARRSAGSWREYGMFLSRRLARIYPLYLLVTVESALAALALTPHEPGTPHFGLTLTANVMMVQAWGLAPSFEGAAWSISTEWAAYLLFPVLLWLSLARDRRVALGLVLASVAAIAVLSLTPGLHSEDEARNGPLDIYSSYSAAPLVRCLAEFSLGILLAYRWFRATRDRPDAAINRPGWCTVVGVAIVLLMMLPGTDAIVVVLFPLLIVSAASAADPAARLLCAPVVLWLGEISYSTYLLHGKFVRVVTWAAAQLQALGPYASPVAAVLTSMLVCACATVVHRRVEKPCRALVRRALEHCGRVLWPAFLHRPSVGPRR